MATDPSNNLLVSEINSTSVIKIAASNQARTSVAGGQNISAVEADSLGNIYTASELHPVVYKNNAVWVTHPLMINIQDLAVDSSNNVYVACTDAHTILKITQAGVVSVYLAGLKGPSTCAVDASGNLYVIEAFSRSILKFAASNKARSVIGCGPNATGIDIDSSGNFYTCFSDKSQVFKNNVFWTSNPLIQNAGDVAVDSNNLVYVACTGTNCILKISAT